MDSQEYCLAHVMWRAYLSCLEICFGKASNTLAIVNVNLWVVMDKFWKYYYVYAFGYPGRAVLVTYLVVNEIILCINIWNNT